MNYELENRAEYLFKMNEAEAQTTMKWTSDHVCTIPRWQFWRRGLRYEYPHFTYAFSPCGIGDAVTISCHCGAKKDVTDYSSW